MFARGAAALRGSATRLNGVTRGAGRSVGASAASPATLQRVTALAPAGCATTSALLGHEREPQGSTIQQAIRRPLPQARVNTGRTPVWSSYPRWSGLSPLRPLFQIARRAASPASRPEI